MVAQEQGDAQRFRSVLNEYQKAPQVTRDRMYLDTMQQIYSNVTKVLVDSSKGSNLLYLPLDKIMQLSATAAEPVAAATSAASGAAAPATPAGVANDARTRDTGRTRERETR